MTRTSHSATISILLGIAALLLLFAFIFVEHHLAVVTRLPEGRQSLLQDNSSILRGAAKAGIESRQSP